MKTLTYHDLYWCRACLPKALREMMLTWGPRCVVAGGFIRSCITHEPVSDVDVFSQSMEEARFMAEKLAADLKKRLHITPNALTVCCRPSIQFITRWTYPTPAQHLEAFDFTIARAALWYEHTDNTEPPWLPAKKGIALRSLCDERFYPDLAARRLVYCNPVREEEAGGSMLRVLKYYQRGYRIPLDSLGAIIGRLLKGVEEINYKKRQTMDRAAWAAQMGHVFTGLLREVDPAIDPDHIAHDPTMAEASVVLEEEGTDGDGE